MKYDLSWAVHLATKGNFSYYFTWNDKKTVCLPIVRNIFLILTVIITEKFNIHFSRVTWLEATRSFLLDCTPNFINCTPNFTFFACILICTSVPKGRKWLISSQLPLMESETAHIQKKLNYFVVNVFLFVDDDVKRNDLELYFMFL